MANVLAVVLPRATHAMLKKDFMSITVTLPELLGVSYAAPAMPL